MAKDSILAKFKKLAIAKPTAGAAKKDPIANFIEAARAQQGFVDHVVTTGPDAHDPKKYWFRPYQGGFTVRFGKTPIPIEDQTYFKVDTLAEVKELLSDVVELAQKNDDFRSAINDASAKRSESLKGISRKPKAKK